MCGLYAELKAVRFYVTADEKIKKITVIPTDGEKITEDDISKALKKNIKLPDGESVKNGAEIIIDREKYLLIIKGDALSDGMITAGDAHAVLRITARLDDASDAVRDASDINSDGKITASEARDMLRFIAKLTDRLFNYTEDKTNLSESIKDEINSLPSDSKHTEKPTVKMPDTTAESTTLKKPEPTAEITTGKQTEPTTEITTKKYPNTKTENTTEKQPETSTEPTTVKKPEPTAEITTEKRTETTTEITTKQQSETTSEPQITTENTSKNDYENVSHPYEEESSLPEKENKKTVWIARAKESRTA